MGLRVGFAGTPAFAATALDALADAGFTIPVVLTRPDKPKGRGQRVAASAVKLAAQARGLPVVQPPSLRAAQNRAQALAHQVDVLVVAAYGLILPQDVLDWPRHGCLNIHASRLPRWRGAAPIQRAIEAGDAATGVTIMKMDAGLDTGPIVDVRTVPIDSRDTAGSLHDKLAGVGAELVVSVLRRLERDGSLEFVPQPEHGVTYASKIGRDEARIDWSRDADSLDRIVRALEPDPGAFSGLDGTVVKIRRAEPVAAQTAATPGTIVTVDEGLVVAAGNGALRLLDVQPAGGRRMSARAFAAGRALAPGSVFVTPSA